MKRYTADLHLQHNKVLEYDNRPFNNIQDHDNYIIDSINYNVKYDDELYILGDISWKANKSIELLSNIKCKKIYFLIGNHDFDKNCKIYEKLGWNNLGLLYHDKESKLVLSHYPLEEWYKSRHINNENYLHLHGHSHGNSRKLDNRVDIGLTFNPLGRPISLDEINLLFRY